MNDDLHLLTGAYAVHALPAADLAPFERHLTRCPSCRAEVRRLRETAARLAAPVPPPPALRTRLLGSLHPHGGALREQEEPPDEPAPPPARRGRGPPPLLRGPPPSRGRPPP
ncbi:RskA family anti-sigma factor [Nonomuraea sp. NPDC003214]